MLRDHLGRVLDRVAGLFIRSGLFQDMGRQHVAHIVGSMRQQPLDRTTICPWVVDPVTLDRGAPRLVKGVLAISGICARHLGGFHKQGARVGRGSDQPAAVTLDPCLKQLIEAAKVRQDQAEGFCPEEGRVRILERNRGDQDFPALVAAAPAQFAALHIFQPPLRRGQAARLAQQQFAQILLAQTGMQADP